MGNIDEINSINFIEKINDLKEVETNQLKQKLSTYTGKTLFYL